MCAMTPDDIRAARNALGWSQDRLARYLGKGVRTIRRWEAGGSAPDAANVDAIERLAKGERE